MKIKEEQEMLSNMLDQNIEATSSNLPTDPPADTLTPEPVFTIDYKKLKIYSCIASFLILFESIIILI